MGGGRRGKGNHSQNNNSNRKNNSSSNFQKESHLTKQQEQQIKVDMQVSHFHQLFKEVEDSAKKNRLFASWKEVAIAVTSLIALGFASIIIGVAAGMTISLHYFEDPLYREGVIFSDGGAAYKVTSYDNDILARNSMDVPSNLHPGRVIKSNRNQERLILSVVPVEQEGNEILTDKTTAFRDIFFTQPSIKPVLCADGETMGYNDWNVLKAVVRELNALSAEKFLRWHDYFGSIDSPDFGAFEDDAFYYEDETVLKICPDITLKARRGSIFINAENLLLECDGCTVDVGGSHFSFGPHARNILIRGVIFRGARSSSLNFHYNGADATFEDCLW
eukprot:CAMPEP_0194188708 /NCGR_PEP_ID=MMETSP0154-20130528/56035_1 /TAXON_ID=1049557 /ORGANISM="Thalassiothrix antarctica, Strain L6-D1" /LENGTH=332 /DNA_ID=CAMNT_0038909323 /DNA_START=53 /DNA_END=1048 /DNA_ORIENTATION=-